MPDPLLTSVRAAVLAGAALFSTNAAHALQAADYQRAERVHDSHLRGALRNASVLPNWLSDGRFWYERDDAQGRRQAVLVDPLQALSPDGGYLVDTVSSLEQPPRTVLRASGDGREALVLEQAVTRAVLAAGWRSPRRERLLAADGRTPIFATLYLPRDYRDDGSFPVIDAMYGGSFISNAPVTYAEAVSALNPVSRASLAELGFAVVSIDARGTGGRDKACCQLRP